MVNKNIIALGFVSFFTDLSSSMVTSILPLFIVYSLQEGVDKLGFIVAIATFISYAFRILFGYLSDRLGIVKPFVVTGYLLSAITKPLLYFSTNWQSVAALRGVERVGKAIRSASKDALISAYSEGKSGKSFGFHKMMDIAGELLGSVIVFLLLYFLGESERLFREIFAWTLLPGILAVLVVIFFVKDVPYQANKKSAFDFSGDRALMPILFLYFGFIFFLFDSSFFMIKAKESGISTAYIPLLVVVLNLTQTIISYPIGVWIDKIGSPKILLYSFIFGVLALIALRFDFIVQGFILLGVSTVSGLNAMRSYISDSAENRATVYGIFYGGVAISAALGAVITGMIWRHFGVEWAIGFSLAGLVLMLLVYLYKHKVFYKPKIF